MFLPFHPRITLQDGGAAAFCLNKIEARYLYDHDIPAYFQHGIALRPGDTVFDVGANIGLFALSVYERYGTDVNVYAFEPIPPIFEVLRLNADRFAPGKLKAFPFGLSKKQDSLTFSYFPRLPCRSSAYLDQSNLPLECDRFKQCLLKEIEAGKLMPRLRWVPLSVRSAVLDRVVKWLLEMKRFSCEVKTVSEIVREHDICRIDLLKVDVEGGELDVLRGIEHHDWQKVRQVVLEIENFSKRSQEAVALLDQQGFKRIEVDEMSSVERRGDVGMIYAFT